MRRYVLPSTPAFPIRDRKEAVLERKRFFSQPGRSGNPLGIYLRATGKPNPLETLGIAPEKRRRVPALNAGDKLGFLKAAVQFALRRYYLGSEFREYLKQLKL